MASSRRAHKASPVIVGLCLTAFLYSQSSSSFTLPPRRASSPSELSLSAPVGAALGILVAFTGCVPEALANAPGKWTYSEKGADWGEDFPACDGKMQTPIDLKDKDVSTVSGESMIKVIKYKPIDVDLANIGKTVQANGNYGTIKLPDGEYESKQFHFHFPAEHEVDGKLAAGEMHIVHQKKGSSGLNDLAVVGILLKNSDASTGPEGKFFKKLGFATGLPLNEGSKVPVTKVDLNAFSSQYGAGFYHYKGSLTTPPCAETVHWYVLKRGAPVTKQMVDAFKARFPPNNRGILPRNGRPLVASTISFPGEF